ncbi:hypothetical protein LWI29_033197 [Acer saccharum]|uniref:UBC core domain-containing protein n=1 Tax=Acer saccharum TaxID=4024 RepID=A0AA39VIT9_ACESA|nr:hypothetical protein LWI29_033197 [Acer saccharum]
MLKNEMRGCEAESSLTHTCSSFLSIGSGLCRNPDASRLKSVGLVDESNIFEWSITIVGQRDSLYDGGIFKVSISFPSDYPNSPTTVKFTTEIWHPNWYFVELMFSADDGRVYGYGLAMMPDLIVGSIRSMLSRPNIGSPANIEAAVSDL